ncbi:MAG: hypothetical protein K5881_03180 [Saccharofermentans sp.]|nr:hypothetical protein [Saccharofermentans sp.]
MKRILRKAAGLFVAAAMVTAMGVTALADTELPGSGVAGSKTATLETTLVIYKEITAYNPDGLDVQAPIISYSYSIAPGDADKQITDADDISVKTKAGLTGATITETVAWGNTDVLETASDGKANVKPIKIDFSGVTFTGAGVYRYVIEESVTTGYNKAESGITEGGISETRYLDVYVRDGDQSGEYIIYGYVLFENNNAHIDGTSDASAGTKPADAVKTQGFVDATSTDADLTADSYYTYNLTVGKTLENDNAHTDNKFIFNVKFTNTAIKQKVDLVSSVDGTATLTEIGAANINEGLTSEPTIANGGSVKYVGIPCGTTVEIYEVNNVETAAYKSSSSGADTDAAEKVINYDVASETASVSCDANDTGDAKEVMFTNTLELISPTGVAMAILPFVILLGFGIGFMVISTTKRREEQA